MGLSRNHREGRLKLQISEEIIIKYCSPTLAGIKTGNLFSVKNGNAPDIRRDVRELNELLKKKGLRVTTLKETKEYTLIYVYRPDRLRQDLQNPVALNILKHKGYSVDGTEYTLTQLSNRLRGDASFPHEIGLFLGYPPSDVECFIRNPEKGVKYCGCWKAYSEPEKARRIFDMYKRCTQTYHEMNKKGKSLAQLTVATC